METKVKTTPLSLSGNLLLYVLGNTKSNTWAMNLFLERKLNETRTVLVVKAVQTIFLRTWIHPKINHWLSRFVTEIKKQDGTPYPPWSIHLILAALQRKLLESKPTAPRFCDNFNHCYRELGHTCDFTYCELRKQMIGFEVQHTTTEEEQRLWEVGVLGVDTLKKLQ